MPKWCHHRSVAKDLRIQLSEKEMKDIDSILDGMKKDYEHDFWRYNAASLKKFLQEMYNLYGVEGFKYCLLHVLLDTLRDFIVSEKTRETLGAKMIREYAGEIAFKHAVCLIELHVKDCLQEHNVIFEQFLSEIRSKEKEIAGMVNELPEVKAQVERIERFKNKRVRAEEIARKYGAQGFDIPWYTSFILELLNDKKRGSLTKEAWANKILEKYEQNSKGTNKRSEKIFDDLVKIAKSLGYIS
ncbi:MAG: hypothetical protein QXR17_02245 [Candidatus Bathyarchaeia archaeon]